MISEVVVLRQLHRMVCGLFTGMIYTTYTPCFLNVVWPQIYVAQSQLTITHSPRTTWMQAMLFIMTGLILCVCLVCFSHRSSCKNEVRQEAPNSKPGLAHIPLLFSAIRDAGHHTDYTRTTAHRRGGASPVSFTPLYCLVRSCPLRKSL